VQVAQSQPIIGTPWLVPDPRMVSVASFMVTGQNIGGLHQRVKTRWRVGNETIALEWGFWR
jgi:hypothetical protein